MRIRAYEPRFEDELLAFRRRVFAEFPYKGDRACFEWEFDRNPLGSSLPIHLLLLERMGDRIVGQISALRDRLLVAGEWRECLWLYDLIIDPAFRGGPAVLALFRREMASAPIVLTTGPRPGTRRVCEVLGWTRLDVTHAMYCVLRPTRLAALAEANDGSDVGAAAEGRRHGESRLAGLRHAALRLALPVADRVVPSVARLFTGAARAAASGRGARVERIDRFDAAWDADFDRLTRRCGVTVYRTAAILNWRFVERPIGRYELFVLRAPGGALRGSVVLKWMARPSVARWMEVADYLVDPDDVAGFRSLVRAALLAAGTAGVDFVRFRLSRPEHRALLRAPLWIEHTRPVTDEVFTYSRDAALVEALRSSPWHLTALAGDRLEPGRDEWKAPAAT
ncbi:MAG TPA: hypothetical protein VMY76_04680 [Gemmatimonadales bacterium]|nr:hypothetical protein [Gemmatimonadales bacterium]